MRPMVFLPWAFKQDHLKPVKLILFQKNPPFYPGSHYKPFPSTPEKGRKEGAGAENGKRELILRRLRFRGVFLFLQIDWP